MHMRTSHQRTESCSTSRTIEKTNATSCASTTVASALHWAFKHVHDETVLFLESNGERDASKRIKNILVPIEEQLANMLDQEFNRVANVLILRPTDAESTTI